ncbi:MAG: hypothetical protein JWM25_1204 [Thermoleophilia bacterium]|nr:hypothetical protein [Thermoleophilia bacterium]MCZ4496621.1 hypothetical protein [Thermoleophilia bacterium]
MKVMSNMGRVLAGLLIGIGVAITAKTVSVAGGEFAVGYVYGPGLIAAGIVRLRLQRMLDGHDDRPAGGDDGDQA